MAAPYYPSPTIEERKRAARQAALAARAACDPAAGADLARHVLTELAPPRGVAVSGFWPMAGEIDLRPLLAALHARGHPVLLPHTPKRGQPLTFRHWHPGAQMVRERFGTYRPDGEIGTPDWLFVPLVAFDAGGRRLGYGGGFYDRTLPLLRHATVIGCAFAAQQLDEVPADAYDAPLHAVATERGVIRFKDF